MWKYIVIWTVPYLMYSSNYVNGFGTEGSYQYLTPRYQIIEKEMKKEFDSKKAAEEFIFNGNTNFSFKLDSVWIKGNSDLK